MTADLADHTSSSDAYFRIVRAGTWFLVPPDGTDSENAAVVADVVQALKSDTRVLEVLAPDLDEHWTSRVGMYPDEPRSTSTGILTGRDSFEVLELSNYLRFKVRVPIKNQELHHGADDVPSDTYWVAWNGVCIFVMWEQSHPTIPLSGGHVIATVLRDVLSQISCGLYVQACGPHCSFGFLHTNVWLENDPSIDDYELATRDERSVSFRADLDFEDPMSDLEWVAMSLGTGLGEFASYKNVGRRVIDMESALRDDLAHLLGHYHAHTLLVSEGRRPKALYSRWQARGWRKEAWSLVSRTWLGMTNLETLRRVWNSERTSLLESEDLLPMLSRDFVQDEAAILGLQTESISETVNQVSSALNNRMAVTATVWGALAGGIAGGAAGVLGG